MFTLSNLKQDTEDLIKFILDCNKNLNKNNYIQSRGITSEKLLNFFNIGYYEDYLILPYGKTLQARNTKQKRFYKLSGEDKNFFNEELTDGADVIIINESIIDSLSIYQSFIDCFDNGYINYKGYKILVIATNSTSNTQNVINKISDKIIILNLDNDNAGRDATIKATSDYNTLIEFKQKTTCKDANERLINEPNELKQDLIKNLDYVINNLKDTEYNFKLSSILDTIGDKEKCYKTNYNKFNELINGGFYENKLYILGALSSLGKTTFLINIATQLAENNYKVLYISLETSKVDFYSKIISKLTYYNSLKNDRTESYAKTGRTYLNIKKKIITCGEHEAKIIKESEEYFLNKINDNLLISTEHRDINAIESLVNRINPQIIIIDYLQILTIQNDRLTDKQKIDTILNKLVDLKRRAPIICISSINRQNYLNSISLESFKDSGNIEYSSDVLIGLEPYNLNKGTNQKSLDNNKQTIENTKQELESILTLNILKNRDGGLGKQNYKFYKLFSCFEEQNEIN
jgi:replicative DNA helicase